jgi:hypothetical protein
LIDLYPRSAFDEGEPAHFQRGPTTEFDLEIEPDGASGTISFEGLEALRPMEPDTDLMSGHLTWSCK